LTRKGFALYAPQKLQWSAEHPRVTCKRKLSDSAGGRITGSMIAIFLLVRRVVSPQRHGKSRAKKPLLAFRLGQQLPETRETVERDIDRELVHKPVGDVPAHLAVLLVIDLRTAVPHRRKTPEAF